MGRRVDHRRPVLLRVSSSDTLVSSSASKSACLYDFHDFQIQKAIKVDKSLASVNTYHIIYKNASGKYRECQ